MSKIYIEGRKFRYGDIIMDRSDEHASSIYLAINESYDNSEGCLVTLVEPNDRSMDGDLCLYVNGQIKDALVLGNIRDIIDRNYDDLVEATRLRTHR